MNKTPKINRLFLVTVIWILLSGIFLGFIPFVRSMDATQLMLLSQLLYLMPVIGFMIINKVDPRKWMPFKPLKLSVIAMVILYAVLMIPVTSWLNLLSMLFVRNAFESSQSELTQNALWVNMIVMAVIPPICEEFTFRGLYYNGYRQRGVWCAILGSALAFGLMHMNFNQFCYAFVPGIALGILLEATALWNFCRQFFYKFRSIDNTGHDRCDQCLFRDRGDLYFCSDRSADLDCETLWTL